MCEIHTTQELALYCETCDKLMCRDCYILSKDHEEHKTGYYSEMALKFREEIASDLKELSVVVKKLSCDLDHTQSILEQAVSNHQELRRKAEEGFEALMRSLQKQKEDLLAKIQQEMVPPIDRLKKQKTDLSIAIEEITSTIEAGREISETPSDLKFMAGQKNVKNQLQALKKASDQAQPIPFIQHTDFGIVVLDTETLEATCKHHTFMLKPTMPDQITADVSSLDAARLYQEMVVPLTINTPLSSNQSTSPRVKTDIQCSLQLFRNASTVGKVSIITESPQKYNIVVAPQQRGRHTLAVTVNGENITDSPFNFKVKVPFTDLCHKLKELPCEKPFGLTTSQDRVLLVEEGKKGITVLKDHQPVHFMPLGEKHLAEITVHAKTGHMFVTTGETHKVLKLDRHGESVSSIDSSGNSPQDFKFSNGLCINSYDELYVCDTGNHEVKVLDTDLNLLRIITGKENGCKPFQCPRDVDFDRHNNAYIAESNRIQVLSHDGCFIRTIGEDKLADAVCLEITGNSIFVTDYGRGCISVFKTDGTFVRDFSKNSFERPQGIAVDSDGFVHVSTNRDKLLIF